MSDLDILARTLYGEAEAGNMADAKAIASVIVNRRRNRHWPDTIEAVCLQPWQFSCWNPNDPNRKRIMAATGPWFDQCKALAKSVIAGDVKDTTEGSTNYYASYYTKPDWAKGKSAVFKVGHKNGDCHLFFNNIDTKPPVTAKESLDQQRPLSTTGTVRAAKVAAGGAVGVLSVASAVQQAAPAMPLVLKIMDYAPWLVIGLLLMGIAYMVWCRVDDRSKGLR